MTDHLNRKKIAKPSNRWFHILAIAFSFLAILYFYPHPDTDELYQYRIGQQWEHEDLVSQVDFSILPDSAVQAQIRDSIKNNFTYYYRRVDVNVRAMTDSVKHSLERAFQLLMADSTLNHVELERASKTIRDNVRSVLNKAYSHNVLVPYGQQPRPLQIIVSQNGNTMDDKFTMVKDITEEIIRQATDHGYSEIANLADISHYLVPNAVVDTAMSADAMASRVAAAIDQQTRKISHGDVIIRKGAPVGNAEAKAIDEYSRQLITSGKGESRSSMLLLLGQILYIMLLLGCLIVYMITAEPRLWRSQRDFGFILGLVTVFVILGALAARFLTLGLFIVPVAIVPILLQVFFNPRMALWGGIIVTMLTAGMTASSFQYVIIQFCGISAAVFSIRDLDKRSQLLRTSALVGLAYLVAYVAFEWLRMGAMTAVTGRMALVLCLNAVLTSMAYVLMFGVERLFGYISNVTLVELTDVNAPLLRALSDECPGTFNHVLAVSNLADDAARQIGANAQLTRAGAMYHDIGKLANPIFFTENQHGVNPHDGLSPLKSAEIIINHVAEGLRRAEKAGLPPVIRDFIAEHHGAGQAKYFYFTYCKAHPDEKVDPAPFTYPGPNPRTRETSVLMMADAVEAASRSLKEHTPRAITDLVNKIIDGQIADGLHNDSPLSFHDIKTIKEVFIRRLMTMYHSRIAYPDDPNKKKNGAATDTPAAPNPTDYK